MPIFPNTGSGGGSGGGPITILPVLDVTRNTTQSLLMMGVWNTIFFGDDTIGSGVDYAAGIFTVTIAAAYEFAFTYSYNRSNNVGVGEGLYNIRRAMAGVGIYSTVPNGEWLTSRMSNTNNMNTETRLYKGTFAVGDQLLVRCATPTDRAVDTNYQLTAKAITEGTLNAFSPSAGMSIIRKITT